MSLHPAFLAAPIAHRGLHDLTRERPENGLSAVRAALDAGYGLELDLQISSDGLAMVFHDYELDRVTGETGQVKRRSAEELGQIVLTGSEDYIPRLSEVLTLVAGRVPILLEIKEQSRFMGPVDGVLERAVAADLAGYDGPVAVMSFNPASVAALAKAAPDVPRGMTSGSYDDPEWAPLGRERLDRFRALDGFDESGCCFISHYHKDLSDPAVTALKARGVPVLCWTIRSPEAEAEARRIADNVTFEGYLP
ncbi:glycerophosphodiester phosphodiesterase family protein [Nioella ostreopsis]|uniref:glycerophosphodiester phosphodiesterase family protein n=1 Tax=Nioella ostreopsis TaxID=2448479 RepID=UPI000FDA7E0A|nr:glycerophosphodiester phosphodiesterase family protein [Nioella ostreopsis]